MNFYKPPEKYKRRDQLLLDMDNDNTGAIRDVVTDKTVGSKSKKGDKSKEDKKEEEKKVQV